MKRLIGAVVIFMACLVAVGSVSAFDYANHVSVSPNGKGDLLVFPVFMAMGGSDPIQTDLTIVNTSLTYSVVAKIVFRSYAYSEELLDFLIYLSPTDMWVGSVKYGQSGPIVFSKDQSGPTLDPGQPLVKASCASDSNQMGYIEVIEAWADQLGAPPLAKTVIKNAYDTSDVSGWSAVTTVNTLSASYQISIPSIGWEASDNAFVLRDYDNIVRLIPAEETRIGAEKEALNTTQEVDAALSKDYLAMTYNSSAETGGTLHAFTFPTKLSDYKKCSRTSRASNYFATDGFVHFTLRMFDNEEHTTTDPENPFSPQPKEQIYISDELNFRSVPSGIFDFGWAMYSFDKKGTVGVTASTVPLPLAYMGTPVLPVIIDFNKGLSIRTAAWTDTNVTTGGLTAAAVTEAAAAVIKDYQYSTASTTTIGQ